MIDQRVTTIASREEQLVVFTLGDEIYGVDIARVQEIIRPPAITRVPRTPEFIEGVINLRGKITPVMDLRKRFGLTATGLSRDTRIMVVEIGGQMVGLIVDGVSEVLRVPAQAIEPPSALVTTVDSTYLRAIAKVNERLIILLDLDRIIGRHDQAVLAAGLGVPEPV